MAATESTITFLSDRTKIERFTATGGNMSTATGTDGQAQGYFPRWKPKTSGVVMPEERLSWGQTVVCGLQHCVAMSGSTIIAPLLMGFDPNVAVLFSEQRSALRVADDHIGAADIA